MKLIQFTYNFKFVFSSNKYMNRLYNFLNNLTMNEEFIFFYPQKKRLNEIFSKKFFCCANNHWLAHEFNNNFLGKAMLDNVITADFRDCLMDCEIGCVFFLSFCRERLDCIHERNIFVRHRNELFHNVLSKHLNQIWIFDKNCKYIYRFHPQ